MISRETVRFHCQLEGGRKLRSTAANAVLVPTPATAFARPGLMVSRLRQVGQSSRVLLPPAQPELTTVAQGGLPARRRTSSITLARPMYRPKPARTAVLPSPVRSQ